MHNVTFQQFDLNWVPVNKALYKDDDRKQLEKLLRHIIVDHSSLFNGPQSVFSYLNDLTITSTYLERIGDDLLTTKVEDIASLSVSSRWMQNDTYTQERGTFYALQSGNMKIVDFRTNPLTPGIIVNWEALSGLEHALDFRILMSVEFGTDPNGLQSVRELLLTLQQWDALADIVDQTTLRKSGETVLLNHWSHYGVVQFDQTNTIRVRPLTYPEVEYTITPMWSRAACFSSFSDLSRFVQLTKPSLRPEVRSVCPEFFRVLPRGCGDYLVDFDLQNGEWALMFSPRLGIYYKVAVALQGTVFDSKRDLWSAMEVVCHPEYYVPSDANFVGVENVPVPKPIPLIQPLFMSHGETKPPRSVMPKMSSNN
jgi:hypothetical protein